MRKLRAEKPEKRSTETYRTRAEENRKPGKAHTY
jgi:hypothetical protein